MNILLIKYDVTTSIYYNTSISLSDKFKENKLKVKVLRIFISKKILDKIKPLILPYVLSCFLYKIL